MLLPGKTSFSYKETLITKLTSSLVKNIPSLNNYGLYGGKTGLFIALHIAYNFFENQSLQEIKQAIEFLQTNISENAADTSDNFDKGIFGIGWGIDFLYRESFITKNEIEVLNSFDDELYKLVMYSKAATHDLETGTMGRINYYINRIPETLKITNKYRYVCNYEILMLLTDDFANENENLFTHLRSKKFSIIKENNTGKSLANIFNLLQMLVLKNVYKEITERQWLQCLRQLVSFYQNTCEESLSTDGRLQLNFLYIINCLLKVGQENKTVKNILLSKRELLKVIADLRFKPSNTPELLLHLSVQKLIADLINTNRTTTTYLNNLFEEELFLNWNAGLSGIGGLICIMISEKNFKLIETAFLI